VYRAKREKQEKKKEKETSGRKKNGAGVLKTPAPGV
jgi:hypothetical protein